MSTTTVPGASAKGWAIFSRAWKDDKGREHEEVVLLTDGAFTAQRNCAPGNRHHFVPRIFATRGGAKNYAYKTGRDTKRYRI